MTDSDLDVLLESAYLRGDYEYLFRKAENEQDFFNLIWRLSCERPFEKSWRLLWVLDHATEKRNEFIFPILDELYRMVLKTQNESYIRQGMKLLLRCPIKEEFASDLLEKCIEWMNNPKAKISSQVYGLEFFFRMCLVYPEMSPELIAYIDDMIEREPSAGFRVRLRKAKEALENKKTTTGTSHSFLQML
jgi:hypothetical protein